MKVRIVAAVAVIVVLAAGLFTVIKVRAGGEYAEELGLARQEGLPTTGAEFEASLPQVADSQNAAPFYAELRDCRMVMSDQATKLDRELNVKSGAGARTDARNYLSENERSFSIVDQALARPHCRFHRDWNQGAAVLYPELSDINYAARALLIRGSLAALNGRPVAALADVGKAMKMARQLGEEPLELNQLGSVRIEFSALDHLAYWAFLYRRPAYAKELARCLDEVPLPDFKDVHRFDLVEVLSTIDMSFTEEGLRNLGLKPDQVGDRQPMLMLGKSPDTCRADVVKAVRAYWAALHGPVDRVEHAAKEADSRLYTALLAFPIASYVYEQLGPPPFGPLEIVYRVKAHKVALTALLRALASGDLRKSPKTDDLLSPWTHKPIAYAYDAGQIVITVDTGGAGSGPYRVRVPPTRM